MVVILVWAMAYQWTHMGTMTGGVAQHQHGRPAFRGILCYEAWLKLGKSEIGASIELVMKWDFLAYWQKQRWDWDMREEVPDEYREGWVKHHVTGTTGT
jgi:hypothetical protein